MSDLSSDGFFGCPCFLKRKARGNCCRKSLRPEVSCLDRPSLGPWVLSLDPTAWGVMLEGFGYKRHVGE